MSSPSAIIATCHSGIKSITFAGKAVYEYSEVVERLVWDDTNV